jgi:hypothetical protein
MRSRLMALSLAVLLSLFLSACNKQPTDSASTDTASNTAMNTAPEGKTRREGRAEVPPQPVVIPSGQSLTVSLGQAVGSKISQPGQTFAATLSTPIEVDGKTVIPAGAAATGTVVDAKPLGRFAGGASLTLKLTSITVKGEPKSIETSSVVQTARGKGKRTGVMAGGGAGVGALIGGLAGGGKGALIGGLAGAGAGTAGAAFTGNKDIVLPAESALTFTLSQSLEVR